MAIISLTIETDAETTRAEIEVDDARVADLLAYAQSEYSALIDDREPTATEAVERMWAQTVKGWYHNARASEIEQITKSVAPPPEVRPGRATRIEKGKPS